MSRLREELGRLSSLGVRVGAGEDSARYTLRWGGEVAHDGNCLFEAVAAALGAGEPAASVRRHGHSAERIFSKMCTVVPKGWTVCEQQAGGCFAVSSGLPAVQVRARCVAQFLALREAGALPPDIDQTIRNLYWCAPPAGWADACNAHTWQPQPLLSSKRLLHGQAQDCQLTPAPCACSPDLAAGWAVNFIQEHKLLVPAAALARAETLVAAREATGTPYNEAAEAVRAQPPAGLLANRAVTSAAE